MKRPPSLEAAKLLYNSNQMTKDELSALLKALRAGLAELLGDRLDAVYLYGSQARGDARPGSDIDVLELTHGSTPDMDVLEVIHG